MARWAPHLIGLLTPISAAVTLLIGGWWTLTPIILLLGLYPFLDSIAGSSTVHDVEEEGRGHNVIVHLHGIRDMICLAFSHIGLELTWSGEGVDTMATDQNGVVRVRTNPKFFRPAEVDLLIGDPAYAKEKLGWETKTTF